MYQSVVYSGKACLTSQVLSSFLHVPSEGAGRASGGREFHNCGSTTEKARFLVVVFQASLRVRTLSHPACEDLVGRADLTGRRHSARQGIIG